MGSINYVETEWNTDVVWLDALIDVMMPAVDQFVISSVMVFYIYMSHVTRFFPQNLISLIHHMTIKFLNWPSGSTQGITYNIGITLMM